MNDENQINDGGPAFPSPGYPGDANYTLPLEGMSLRDWLAANAPISLADAMQYCRETRKQFDYEQVFKTLCQMQLVYADTMLKAMSL